MDITEDMILELKEDCEELYHKKRSIPEKIQLMEYMISQADSISNRLKSELILLKNNS